MLGSEEIKVLENNKLVQQLKKILGMDIIMGLFKPYGVARGSSIVTANQIPKHASIIVRGQFINQETQETIRVGSSIGFYSLFHQVPNDCTIITMHHHSLVIQVSASRLDALMKSLESSEYSKIKQIICNELKTEKNVDDKKTKNKLNSSVILTLSSIEKRMTKELNVDGSVLILRDHSVVKESYPTKKEILSFCSNVKHKRRSRSRTVVTAAKYSECEEGGSSNLKQLSSSKVLQNNKVVKNKLIEPRQDTAGNRLQPIPIVSPSKILSHRLVKCQGIK